MEQHQRFSSLFTRYAEKDLSTSEREEFFGMIRTGDYDSLLEQMVGERWEMKVPEWIREHDKENAEVIFQAVMNRVKVKRLVPFRRIAVAAIILIIVGAGSYFIFLNKPAETQPQAGIRPTHDVVAPATNRAMITMANGQRVYLDSAVNGTLASEGGTQVLKTADGEIIYEQDEKLSTTLPVTYNTLFNPRGSKVISVMLVDGSKVWLNAESSLKYFTTVGEGERNVEITGEAYFEVAKDAQRKFLVRTNGITTEVLGTHFNINNYADEEDVKVTLLEGSIKVGFINGQSALLRPGQQASLAKQSQSSQIIPIQTADVGQVMAWKNGFFSFNNAGLQQVMRQLSRWYDVTVEYEDGVPDLRFGGELPNNSKLSEALEILKTSGVQFKIDNRKVIISKP